MMEFATERRICRLIVVKQDDSREASTEATLAESANASAAMPADQSAGGWRQRWSTVFFHATEEKTDFPRSPGTHGNADQIVEMDEKLWPPPLLPRAGWRAGPGGGRCTMRSRRRCAKGTSFRCASCRRNRGGHKELLESVVRLLPTSSGRQSPNFLKGEGEATEPRRRTADPSRHVVAHVIKVIVDPFVGKLGVFACIGTIRQGSQLYVGDGAADSRGAPAGAHWQGSPRKSARRAGRHRAIADRRVHFDAVLHDSHDEDHFRLQCSTCRPRCRRRHRAGRAR